MSFNESTQVYRAYQNKENERFFAAENSSVFLKNIRKIRLKRRFFIFTIKQ